MPYGYPQHMNQQQVYLPFPSATSSTSRHASATALRYVRSSSAKKDSPLQPDTEAAPAEPALRPSPCEVDNKDYSLTIDAAQMYPGYDAYSGHYQPYYGYGQYPGQPPQSPRPPYPSPYATPQSQMQAPFHPPDMSRSASQSSQRPPSSLGQPQTPSLSQQTPHPQTPAPSQSQQPSSSAFVKPVKRSAIKITDANGNEINFNKASPSPNVQAQPQTPVIVSTPNAPTPPPRAPSSQHNRAENQPANAKSAEETKNAFQEQVKRHVEDQKRKEQEERDGKAKSEKDAADAKTKSEKDEADAKAKVQKDEADAKAKAEKDAADAKIKADKDAADAQAKAQKDEANAKAKAEQDEAAAKAKEREEAEAAAQKEATATAEKAAAAAAEDQKAKEAAEATEKSAAKSDAHKGETEETEDERLEREIAEMEAKDREDEERERAYAEKKKRDKEAQAKIQAEKDANADEELKRQEREAEEREEARERERNGEVQKAEEPDEEAKSLFAALKKPEIGPGASAESTTEESPSAADAMPPPPASQARSLGAQKPKPTHLKLETNKRVEPAEPTPGMQALKSARFLNIKEDLKYPENIQSPNPALTQGGARKGRAYDKAFLLQFQKVFQEKPSVDWDQKVKDTLGPGDEPGSARGPQSAARSASGMPRQASGRGGQAAPGFQGVMGQFGGARTLPPGTTSQERFNAASQMGGRPNGPAMPAQMARMPSNIGMGGGMGMNRTGSLQAGQGMQGSGSPRQPSARGGRGGGAGGSKRGNMSRREEADMANKMPLTANMDLAPLQKSTTGWKPTSVGAPSMGAGPDLSGMMAPDMVQRKVKAALNKMTPEKFDKISDQILDIAAQSKNETDGRTLRQVIQLTFEKACDEAHWAGMYAKFCHKMLTAMSPEIVDETIKDKNGAPVVGGALFRKYLLNRCQEEFERGWQANLPEKPEGEDEEIKLLSEEYYVAAAAKRRGLGLIQFIGQLYKLRMLTIRIMHECVMRLLNFEGAPDESAVENLTTLLRSVGGTMDEEEQGRQLMGTYFQRIEESVLKSDALGSRPRFMIMDLVDLRRQGWKEKGGVSKGPKTIDEIHQEAAAAQAKQEMERARTSQRGGGGGGRMGAGRGDARNFSGNVAPPQDYSRTNVAMEDLRRLQNRGTSGRATGGGLGPGGNLGPGSTLGVRAGSRRGLGPPSSGNTTRTNTPPVDKDKKDEPSTQQNAFR